MRRTFRPWDSIAPVAWGAAPGWYEAGPMALNGRCSVELNHFSSDRKEAARGAALANPANNGQHRRAGPVILGSLRDLGETYSRGALAGDRLEASSTLAGGGDSGSRGA